MDYWRIQLFCLSALGRKLTLKPEVDVRILFREFFTNDFLFVGLFYASLLHDCYVNKTKLNLKKKKKKLKGKKKKTLAIYLSEDFSNYCHSKDNISDSGLYTILLVIVLCRINAVLILQGI